MTTHLKHDSIYQKVYTMDTAKLFQNGKSQAVRLPKKYRFEGDKVLIKKLGNVVILMSALFATTLYLTDWLFQVIRNLITSIKL